MVFVSVIPQVLLRTVKIASRVIQRVQYVLTAPTLHAPHVHRDTICNLLRLHAYRLVPLAIISIPLPVQVTIIYF